MGETTKEFKHIPVLLAECLEHLNLKPQHAFVDCTLGGAGHSFEVAKRLGPDGLLIGIDQDEMALAAAKERLGTIPQTQSPQIALLRGNFGDLDDLLLEAQVPGIDAILFDLGVSSPQLDFPQRGFSFKEDAPLDMRMDPGRQTITAAEPREHFRRSRASPGSFETTPTKNGRAALPSSSWKRASAALLKPRVVPG